MNTWYHVALVIKGPTDMTHYINGIADTGTYSGSGGDIAYTPNGSTYIGSGTDDLVGADGAKFDGIIDDVRVYEQALTEVEIEQLYNEGLSP